MEKRSSVSNSLGYLSEDDLQELYGTRTAGSWPSDHHANQHLLNLQSAMQEMARGVKWHTEQDEPELAEAHRQALYALDNAHELMSKATVEVND